jgi:hypothetical protein
VESGKGPDECLSLHLAVELENVVQLQLLFSLWTQGLDTDQDTRKVTYVEQGSLEQGIVSI